MWVGVGDQRPAERRHLAVHVRRQQGGRLQEGGQGRVDHPEQLAPQEPVHAHSAGIPRGPAASCC
jgi:hypothetical protein